MFGASVSAERFEALKQMVDSQPAEMKALANLAMTISPSVRRLQQEKHVLVALVAALLGEICGRSRDQLENLRATIDRVERAAREHVMEDHALEKEAADSMIAYIKSYSETYMRREGAS